MPKVKDESTVTISTPGTDPVTMSADKFSKVCKKIQDGGARKELRRLVEAHEGMTIDGEVHVIDAVRQDVADLIAEKWVEIRRAANEVFAAKEDAPAPIAKATVSIEVDYTDKAKPKITTSLSWNVKKTIEREHTVDDPRQGKLEYELKR